MGLAHWAKLKAIARFNPWRFVNVFHCINERFAVDTQGGLGSYNCHRGSLVQGVENAESYLTVHVTSADDNQSLESYSSEPLLQKIISDCNPPNNDTEHFERTKEQI